MQNIITIPENFQLYNKSLQEQKTAEGLPAERFYDEIADKYDNEYSYSLARAENEFIINALVEKNIHSGRVLDLGCGTGLFLDYVQKESSDYYGIDISSNMLSRMKMKHPLSNRIKMNITDIDSCFPQDYFDNVISLFGSFSYIQEPARSVENVYNVLKPGGKFFMMLCTERNKNRKNYVGNKFKNETELFTYSEERVHKYFNIFNDLEVTGFNYSAEDLPAEFDTDFYKKYLEAENRVFGRQYPYNHYYILVSGKK